MKANGADINDAAIQGVKVGMMGPLAGIGDPVFWFTVRPILGAVAASLAVASGSIVGPLLFFVLWNIILMVYTRIWLPKRDRNYTGFVRWNVTKNNKRCIYFRDVCNGNFGSKMDNN